MFCISPAMAALQTHDLSADETRLIRTSDLHITPNLDVDFKSDYSRTLIELGDLSLSRKILMNAGGARIEPTAFQFDLHLEISYKFI